MPFSFSSFSCFSSSSSSSSTFFYSSYFLSSYSLFCVIFVCLLTWRLAFFLFSDRFSHFKNPDCSGAHSETRLVMNPQRFSSLCFPSVGIKDMHHHAKLAHLLLFFFFSSSCLYLYRISRHSNAYSSDFSCNCLSKDLN